VVAVVVVKMVVVVAVVVVAVDRDTACPPLLSLAQLTRLPWERVELGT
jgi:hypothetical protein